MAIASLSQGLYSDKLVQRRVIDTLRALHGIGFDRDAQMQVSYNNEKMCECVAVEFSPPKTGASSLPLDVCEKVDRIAKKLHDPFRGPVIQAAVPELHADLEALLAAVTKINQPYRLVISVDELRSLME